MGSITSPPQSGALVVFPSAGSSRRYNQCHFMSFIFFKDVFLLTISWVWCFPVRVLFPYILQFLPRGCRFSKTAVLSHSSCPFLLRLYLKCVDRTGNRDCVYADNGIRETLRSAFTVPSCIDLFLSPLQIPLFHESMSNPLWCSHVCWSRARVAWD